MTKIRRFYALDDCGTRINPMIIEDQVHGGLTEAFGIAMGQEIHYDPEGNVTTASYLDYFLPSAVETPKWETDWTTTPSPHHPIGAKGVAESPNVGGVPSNAEVALYSNAEVAGGPSVSVPGSKADFERGRDDPAAAVVRNVVFSLLHSIPPHGWEPEEWSPGGGARLEVLRNLRRRKK